MVKLGNRKVEPVVKALTEAGKQVVSISRCNAVGDDACFYEAYRTYLLPDRGEDGIYGALGSTIHDQLQMIMDGNATSDCLLPALENRLANLELAGVNFPKDQQGGTAIRDAWLADMRHFCQHFVPPRGRFTTEEFCLLKINDDLYSQGYIDLVQHHEDGSQSIWDWKTSSLFKKTDLLHHGRQLVCYQMAKEEKGIAVRTVGWIMLKYVDVSFIGKARVNSKEATVIHKVFNRGKFVRELQPHLKVDLCNGMSELEADLYLERAVAKNDLSVLPEWVAEKYTVKPHVQKYEVTDVLKEEAKQYIIRCAGEFARRGNDPQNWPHRKFFRFARGGKKVEDTFYCHTLCSHRNSCKYIRRHDEQMLSAPKGTDNEILNLF